jgi:uncharacterized protein
LVETAAPPRTGERNATARYVAPFVAFLLVLSLSGQHFIPAAWEAPLWFLIIGLICWVCWPRDISLRPRYWLSSTVIGIAVFMIWIAPDYLIPGYRNHPLFVNGITGQLHSSIQPDDLRSHWVLTWRTLRAALVVPIVEELFWRGWLMRWLIDTNFQKIRLGTYAPLAFWLTAVLFASEHGPYWDVGLITGVIYNYWLVRTRSLADCVLMHAVTNAVLSLFVIATAQWQYWQ